MVWFNRLLVLVLALWFTGPAVAAADQELNANELQRVTVDEVRVLQSAGETIIFLDTRTDPQWEAADRKLPGARRLTSNGELKAFVDTVPRDAAVVTYCT